MRLKHTSTSETRCGAASRYVIGCAIAALGSPFAGAQTEPQVIDESMIEEVTVIGAKVSDYFNDGSASVLRSSVPTDELSRSIQIFNAEFIEDFQPIDIGDIATFASNVSYTGNTNGRGFAFNIRGFDAPLLNDGLLNTFGDAGFETYNLDRMEVLKGPDSLQYGRSNAGGMINLVRKLPKKEAHAQIGARATTLPGYRAMADVGAAITHDSSLRYRLVGVYSNEDSVADYRNAFERRFFAPSLAYDFDANHSLSAWAEYLDESYPLEANNPIGANGEILIAQERITAHPDNSGEKDHLKFGLELNSRFGDWTTNLRYIQNDFENNLQPFVINFPFFVDTNTVGRVISEQVYEGDEFLAAFTVNGDFDIAGLRNRLTIGVDYTESDAGFGQGIFFPITPMDVFDTDFDYGDLPAPTNPSANTIETTQAGVVVQDHISLTGRLVLSVGVRFDEYEAADADQFDAVSPQLGIVYDITDDFSAYANYSESFTPNTAFDRNGQLLDPETGEGYELGLRYSPSPKFSVSAALFDVEKTNVAQPDPLDPFNFSIASGVQTSRGVEIDIAGNITDNWSIVASYGYTDTEDKANNPGNSLLNAPEHTASLFTTHSLAGLGFSNFIIGGGLRHIGRMFVVDPANSISIPSVTVFDANITYQAGPWTAILTVQNLTDEEYLESALFTSAITNFGAPRNAFLSVLYDF
ncbi:MAG: TonB-dependent receptor [Pseudomonadota bacterium]